MRVIEQPDEFIEFDSEFAYFQGELSQLASAYQEIQAVFEEFSGSFGVPLTPEDPSGFQDGALLTVVQEYQVPSDSRQSRTGVLGGFYFSRYGRLFFGGSLNERSQISLTQWASMRDSLQDQCGFVLVDEVALDSKYSGNHSKFSAMSWRERFFAPWYQHLEAGVL